MNAKEMLDGLQKHYEELRKLWLNFVRKTKLVADDVKDDEVNTDIVVDFLSRKLLMSFRFVGDTGYVSYSLLKLDDKTGVALPVPCVVCSLDHLGNLTLLDKEGKKQNDDSSVNSDMLSSFHARQLLKVYGAFPKPYESLPR